MGDNAALIAEANGGAILAPRQRTEAWFAKKCGRLTASEFSDIMDRGRDKKPTKRYYDLITHKTVERLSAKAIKGGGSAATSWGTAVEPYCRTAVEAELGVLIDDVDFVVHPSYDFIGASPDGLIGADGGYESKAPYDMRVHLDTLLYGMPEEHKPQVQGGMWVTGRSRWLFASYDPRHTRPKLRLYTKWIERDDAYIASLERECLAIHDQINDNVNEILARYPQ